MEGRPHNVVHGTIGGNMGDGNRAAQDPIFWLHHCNIDRLWAAWLRQGGGRRDISTTSFLNDDSCSTTRTGPRWSRGPGTRWTTLPASATVTTTRLGRGRRSVLVQAQEPETGVEAGPADVELAASPAPVELGAAAAVTELAPLVEAGGASVFTTDPAAPAPRRKALVLSGVRYEQAPGTVFEIYLNRPEDAPFDPDGPFFAGVFAPFGVAPEEGVTVSFDISGLLNRQIEAGTYDGGPLKVEIRPFALEERDELPAVQIDRILIEREGG